jgi:hypothetical protein
VSERLAAPQARRGDEPTDEGLPQLPAQVRLLVTAEKLNVPQNDDRSRRHVTYGGNVRERSAH